MAPNRIGDITCNIESQTTLRARRPRIVVAGTQSGVGKTTIVAGISRALVDRGTRVQPFKTGPDYIDPGHHSLAAGVPCRNLDTMLLRASVIRELFWRATAEADVSIVEGVMGLYDGASASDERGSAAHLAKVLRAPIVLVVDAQAMARSAGALVHGFASFERSVRVAGVICNRIGSERHFAIVRDAIESRTGIPVLGYLPRDEETALPERHLGLVPAWEGGAESAISRAAELVADHVDLDGFLSFARSAAPLSSPKPVVFRPTGRRQHGANGEPQSDSAAASEPTEPSVPTRRLREKPPRPRIAYAFDDAFHFYYRDNLEILEHLGVELIPVSPLTAAALPEETDLLYIGGGFPELYAEELSRNRSFIDALSGLAARGMPVYGECGGLMYLIEGLTTGEGVRFTMAGLLPGEIRMDRKLRSLGYCLATVTSDCLLGKRGTSFPGHVFHWSYRVETEDTDSAISLEKPAEPQTGRRSVPDGFTRGNVLAGYLHVHFASRRSVPSSLIRAARVWRKAR